MQNLVASSFARIKPSITVDNSSFQNFLRRTAHLSLDPSDALHRKIFFAMGRCGAGQCRNRSYSPEEIETFIAAYERRQELHAKEVAEWEAAQHWTYKAIAFYNPETTEWNYDVVAIYSPEPKEEIQSDYIWEAGWRLACGRE